MKTLNSFNEQKLTKEVMTRVNGGGEPQKGVNSNGDYLYWFNEDTGKYEGVYLDLFA